jgi:ATP-dependent RNA helicase DDX55/SPB4
LPKQRRTGLFSATLNENVLRLKKAGLRNPHSVSVKEKARENLSTPQELKLLFSIVEPRHKLSYLVSLLKKRRKSKSVVYFLTSDQVDYFHQVLRQLVNYPVIKCHGKKNQKLRSKAVKEFTDRSGGAVLVTTDLLCRGVDIAGGVDYVIQFDPPTFAPNFVHRAGRTARAGQAGENLVFVTPSEHEQNYLEFLKLNQKVGDMVELKEEFEILDLETVRQTQLKDKRNFEYAQRAFPSFVCAYKGFRQGLAKLDGLPDGNAPPRPSSIRSADGKKISIQGRMEI